MSSKRSVGWSMKEYAVPSETLLEKIVGYNNYSYGLDYLYSYHRSKGVGHNGRGMILSLPGRVAILSECKDSSAPHKDD
jgi:hypothetical protein